MYRNNVFNPEDTDSYKDTLPELTLRNLLLVGDRMNTFKRWKRLTRSCDIARGSLPSLLMSSRTSHNCLSYTKDLSQHLIGTVGKITDIVFHDKVVDIAGDKLATDNAYK
jgi:hypothetical protein